MEEPKQKCVIFGGGGHARVLIDALQAGAAVDPSTAVEIAGILDRDSSLWNKKIMGIPVLGDVDRIMELADQIQYFIVGIGSVGDPSIRMGLFKKGLDAGLKPLTVIHPRAIVSSHAHIGQGCLLFAGSIVNPGARIGDNVIVNTGAIVEHDCVVGSHVHIATGARLSGTVSVGEGAHIGAGAVIIQNCCVGDFAIVGAGAVVTKPVAQRLTVVGNPAHPVKKEAV